MKQIIFIVLAFFSINFSTAQNTFPSTGNVGIGTAFPSTELDVNGTIQSTGGFYIPYTNAGLFQVGSYHTRLRGGYGEYIDLGGPYGNVITLASLQTYINGPAFFLNGLSVGLIQPVYFRASSAPTVGVVLNTNWVENGSGGPNYGSIMNVGDVNLNTAADVTNELNTITCNTVVNTTGGATKLRGLYYNPTLTSTTGLTNIAIEAVTGNTLLGTTSGNTIIGSSTDDGINKLQVTGNIKATGLIIPTDAAVGKVLTSDANGNATWQTPAGGSGGGSWTLNGSDLVNSNIGFVGIGTNASPNSSDADLKLAVKGNIYAKKLKITQGGWADYVFHQNYDLLPLHKLEKYIQENNHLPEVPTTAEVEKNGIDIGDNQVLLLKKVEELTLYLIEQHKKNEAQQKEIEQLRNELNSLKRIINRN